MLGFMRPACQAADDSPWAHVRLVVISARDWTPCHIVPASSSTPPHRIRGARNGAVTSPAATAGGGLGARICMRTVRWRQLARCPPAAGGGGRRRGGRAPPARGGG